MINLLLVDDHPIVRAGLKAILSGFEDITVCAEAADGAEALTRYQEMRNNGVHLDAVVMDIQMSPMDGITATARFGEIAGPPVLILTTFDTHTDIISAIEAGALGYLLKDAAPQEVHTAVLNTAAGKPTLSPEIALELMKRSQSSIPALSARELEILKLLETGATNKDLAQQLFISQATVKTHLVHIYSKLGVDNRTAAIAEARRQKLI